MPRRKEKTSSGSIQTSRRQPVENRKEPEDDDELPQEETAKRRQELFEQNFKIRKVTLLDSSYVTNLTSADFAIETASLIGLKRSGCMIIVFYIENEVSYRMLEILLSVAKYAPGNKYGAINLDAEKKVADSFDKLKNDPNNPLYYYSLIQLPMMMAYRGGFPQANYNGPRTTQAISEWVLTLACNSNYKETPQLFAGVQVDANRNLLLKLPGERYRPTNSGQFDSNRSMQDLENPYIRSATQKGESTSKALEIEREEEKQNLPVRSSDGTSSTAANDRSQGSTKREVPGRPSILQSRESVSSPRSTQASFARTRPSEIDEGSALRREPQVSPTRITEETAPRNRRGRPRQAGTRRLAPENQTEEIPAYAGSPTVTSKSGIEERPALRNFQNSPVRLSRQRYEEATSGNQRGGLGQAGIQRSVTRNQDEEILGNNSSASLTRRQRENYGTVGTSDRRRVNFE